MNVLAVVFDDHDGRGGIVRNRRIHSPGGAGPHRSLTDDSHVVGGRRVRRRPAVECERGWHLVGKLRIGRTIPGLAEVVSPKEGLLVKVGQNQDPPAMLGDPRLVRKIGRWIPTVLSVVIGDRQGKLLQVSQVGAALSSNPGIRNQLDKQGGTDQPQDRESATPCPETPIL